MAVARRRGPTPPHLRRQGAAKTSPFAERAAMDAEVARRHVNEQSTPPRPWILVLRMTAGTWRSDSSALPKYGVGGANLTTAGCDGAAWLPASHAIGLSGGASLEMRGGGQLNGNEQLHVTAGRMPLLLAASACAWRCCRMPLLASGACCWRCYHVLPLAAGACYGYGAHGGKGGMAQYGLHEAPPVPPE